LIQITDFVITAGKGSFTKIILDYFGINDTVMSYALDKKSRVKG
jgi:hypothetical protein